MGNSKQTLSQVKFSPWVGDNYRSTGFAGRHILVLGESHYCADVKDAVRGITTSVIGGLLEEGAEHEGYMNTYTKFVKAMLGREEITLQDKRAFWHSVIFYNYVQVPMTGPRISPSREDFESSASAFFEVLEAYRPDMVIVWGSRLYNNLPRGGGQRMDLRASDGKWIETWKYFLKDGSEVAVLPVMHPAAAFSPEYWNQVIGLIL